MRVNFREVSLTAHKTVKCVGGCGRKLKRQQKFYQTINPFNKLPDGRVKNSQDIMAELREEAKAWKSEHAICLHCAMTKAKPFPAIAKATEAPK